MFSMLFLWLHYPPREEQLARNIERVRRMPAGPIGEAKRSLSGWGHWPHLGTDRSDTRSPARPAASWGIGVAGRLAVVGRATSLQVCDQDAHNDVRRDVKTSPNFSRSVHRIQNVLECCSDLEIRGIAHPSQCDKETFLARYNDASPHNKRAYTSTQHKLPAVFAEASGHRAQGNA